MEYRLYCLDGTQHIVSAMTLEARDDLAALEEAERRCGTQLIEVWQGVRYVARVKQGNVPLDASDRMSL